MRLSNVKEIFHLCLIVSFRTKLQILSAFSIWWEEIYALVLRIIGCWRDRSDSDTQCWAGWVQGTPMQGLHDPGALRREALASPLPAAKARSWVLRSRRTWGHRGGDFHPLWFLFSSDIGGKAWASGQRNLNWYLCVSHFKTAFLEMLLGTL